MISSILQSLRPVVRHRVWVLSDLQQAIPSEARRCLDAAISDFRALELPVEQIWYLGDAVEEHQLELLEEMAQMQVRAFSAIGAPLKYVLGNHDFDHLRATGGKSGRTAVFRDAVLAVPAWRTTESVDSFYFIDRLGDYTIVFLSDHADPAGRWVSTHGVVHGDALAYPHTPAAYHALRDRIAAIPGPVITCSHYAFAGGNRPSALHDQLFPLPPNIRLHLYGHAHIGDAIWAAQNLYRKVSCVDHHPIVQADIASLEDARGSAIRSALLEIYHDGAMGLYFRNHSTQTWEDALVLDKDRLKTMPRAL